MRQESYPPAVIGKKWNSGTGKAENVGSTAPPYSPPPGFSKIGSWRIATGWADDGELAWDASGNIGELYYASVDADGEDRSSFATHSPGTYSTPAEVIVRSTSSGLLSRAEENVAGAKFINQGATTGGAGDVVMIITKWPPTPAHPPFAIGERVDLYWKPAAA